MTIDQIYPLVADVNQIFLALKLKHKLFTVLDAVSAYLSGPLPPGLQDWLAFCFNGCQYGFRRLPQGFHNSAMIY